MEIGSLSSDFTKETLRTMPAELILIVDDDPICLSVARLVLSRAGFATQTAADGTEALDLLKTLQPDLIVSDIQMPRMDGFELARRARQISRLHDTPMIALTAFANQDAEQQAYDAGFTAYVSKPVNGSGLTIAVRRILARAA